MGLVLRKKEMDLAGPTIEVAGDYRAMAGLGPRSLSAKKAKNGVGKELGDLQLAMGAA